MVCFARNDRENRVPPLSGRVSKRPHRQNERPQCRNTKKRSEVTRMFLHEKHPDLLADLMVPTTDVIAASTKFAAFVKLEQLAQQLDRPLPERLISAETRFHNEYQILQWNVDPNDPKKVTVTATVTLVVGPDSNMDLVKKREAIILATGVEEKDEESDDESMPESPRSRKKSTLGRRIYGFITNRNGWTITVTVTCRVRMLERMKELPLKLYVDINTAEFQSEAIDRVSVTPCLQRMLAYKVTPTVVPRSSRSRSPSVVCLDDEIDSRSSKFSSSGDSVICLDDFPYEKPTKRSSPTTQTNLNAEQQLAVNEIVRYGTTDLFMLFGPLGTGKTSTLVKSIAELVRRGNRVLICTPSNKAADVISCGLLSEDIPPYSLYRHVSRTLDPNSVAPQLRQHAGIDVDGNGDAYFAADDDFDIDDYAIVVSTLGSTPALRKSMARAEKKFSHIVVDEAGQAAEMEIWMPVAFFATEHTRLIVAGDPMQLGPVAPVHLLDNPVYGYKTSILSRLYKNEVFRNNTQNMVQLTKNFRSHEAVVNIVSEIFYDGTLEFTQPAGHDSLCDWHRLPQANFPVFFENVYGRVHTDANGSSSNQTEAEAVVFYVESLLRKGVQAREIGVVSPYTAQSKLIRRLLGHPEVTVDTVEKFQGSERRVIIMTAVRNGRCLGFMEDRQRLNTALSRAQQLLIVIGHASSLEVLPDWFRFISYCKENNAFTRGPDSNVDMY